MLFTHENKGKKYPYASERQNTRAKRRQTWREGDYNPEVLKAIALHDWSEAAE